MENKEIVIGQLEMKDIQQKANEYAQKGAIECIKEYYTGYNSPFKKRIEEQLEKKGISWSLELPDIIATLNGTLSNEIDKIANEAIAKSFIPLVRRLLIREPSEIKFSDILNEFIKSVDDKDLDVCDYSCRIDKRPSPYNWIDCDLECNEFNYSFTLHQCLKEKSKYQLLSLPRDESRNTMKISLDGGCTMELPFTKNILDNNFTSYMARLVLSESIITMDCEDFTDDMFGYEG